MSAESWGLLSCVAFVGLALLGEIGRVNRKLSESIRAHHHAIAKIPALEAEIRTLKKKIEAQQ